MTKLPTEKPLMRQTDTLYRGDPLVVELHPRYLAIRVHGKRTRYNVPYDVIFDLARKRSVIQAALPRRVG